MLANVPPFIPEEIIAKELSRYRQVVFSITKIPLGYKSPFVKHLVSFRRVAFMVFKEGTEELNAVFKFNIDGIFFVSSDVYLYLKIYLHCGKTGHLL